MDNETREMFQLILSEIKDLKGGQAKLESGQAKLESGQAKLEREINRTNLILENDFKPKIDALFTAYQILQDKDIDGMKNDIATIKEDVAVIKLAVRDNSEEIITLKRIK